jgi:hypothetical protein
VIHCGSVGYDAKNLRSTVVIEPMYRNILSLGVWCLPLMLHVCEILTLNHGQDKLSTCFMVFIQASLQILTNLFPSTHDPNSYMHTVVMKPISDCMAGVKIVKNSFMKL